MMAVNDGHLEARDPCHMETQTEDKDFSILEEESAELDRHAADSHTFGSTLKSDDDKDAEEDEPGVQLNPLGSVFTDDHEYSEQSHDSQHAAANCAKTTTTPFIGSRRIVTSSGDEVKVMTAKQRRGSTRGGNYVTVDESSTATGEEASNPMWTRKESWMGFLKENL